MSKIGDKLGYAVQNAKKYFIFGLILWIILILFLVLPFSIIRTTSVDENGKFDLYLFVEQIPDKLLDVPNNLSKLSQKEYFDVFFGAFPKVTCGYILVYIFVVYWSKHSHNYEEIEHGSADWCTKSEMYSILNRNKGILLAQNIFLPLDKFGNTNVLVVGGSGSRKIYILCFSKCI